MKILIISYHYPPCNAIAGLRPKSFADNWSKNHEVKVITRRWKGTEQFPLDYLATDEGETEHLKIHENLEEIYLPFVKKTVKTSEVALGLIKGNLTIDFETNQFKAFGIELCNSWKPDVIFVTSPPINILKLGLELSKVTNSKLVADFRDFENDYLFGHRKMTVKEFLIHKSTLFHTLRILKKVDLITTASEPFSRYFVSKKMKAITIKNGFESGLFELFKNREKITTKFNLTLTGALYNGQNISLILKGLSDFTKDKKDVVINFIGSATNESIKEQIKLAIPKQNLNLTDRIPRSEALAYTKISHILFYVGWKGYKGMYSGKIFEYLGARKTILIAPSDEDVLEKLMIETNAGITADTANEVALFLEEKYKEWKITGEVQYHGIEDEINFYSRENQANLLELELKKLFD